MEISEVIVAEAIAKSETSSIHEGLSSVLKKIEDNTLEDFLNGDKNEAIRKADNETRNIINANLHYPKTDVDVTIDIAAQIIFTIKEYLHKGISNGDVRSILIFLGVNCYLQIEIEKLLSLKELEDGHTKPVSEKIITILGSINLITQPAPDAPYHEKEMIRESAEGFANDDIVKTYRLIEGIERGGRGFHFNLLFEHLLSFLYRINFTCFINALRHLQKPADFIFYLQNLKKEELLRIACEPSLSNKWLNFEIIRQIVGKESKEGFDELEIEAVKTVLNRITISDFDFYKQTVKYFHRSSLFNASTARSLVSIANSQIEEVISECFTIDQYNSNLDSRDSLREQFLQFASDDQFDFLHTLIFNKWRTYFESILAKEDSYQSGLLLTDFANFVVQYHTHLIDDNTLTSRMHELVNKIQFIDSEWATSGSQQITKFHLYHSELFLMTFAYRDKKLNESQLLESYDELINNKIQLSRFVSSETSNQFKQGRQNIDWINEYPVG